mgnify:FL=1
MGITASSSFLDKLRRQKIVAFQSTLSSPLEMNVNEGSKFRLTCSFLSNFDQLDIFWFHNGSLFQSFISKVQRQKRKTTKQRDEIVLFFSRFWKKKMMKLKIPFLPLQLFQQLKSNEQI